MGNERYGSMDSDTFKFVHKQLFNHEEEDSNDGSHYVPSRSILGNNATQKYSEVYNCKEIQNTTIDDNITLLFPI